jgi:hypothetical protein
MMKERGRKLRNGNASTHTCHTRQEFPFSCSRVSIVMETRTMMLFSLSSPPFSLGSGSFDSAGIIILCEKEHQQTGLCYAQLFYFITEFNVINPPSVYRN